MSLFKLFSTKRKRGDVEVKNAPAEYVAPSEIVLAATPAAEVSKDSDVTTSDVSTAGYTSSARVMTTHASSSSTAAHEVIPSPRKIVFADIEASSSSDITATEGTMNTNSTLMEREMDREISHDSQEVRATISEHLKHLRHTWSKLREVVKSDPKKYQEQIAFLDYLHLCEQASTFLRDESTSQAEMYCNAAQELLSDNWRLYCIRAEISKAQGKYTRAQNDIKRMRDCMKITNQDGPESLAIYYGFKIDNMLTSGKEGEKKDVRKQFKKVLDALKAQNSSNSEEEVYARQFSELQQEITDHKSFSKQSEQSIKKKKGLITKITPKRSTVVLDEEDMPQSPSGLQNIIESAKMKLMESELKKLMDSELGDLRQRIVTVASHLDDVDKKIEFITLHMNAIKTSLIQVQQKLNEENTLFDGLRAMLVEYFKAFVSAFSQAYTSAQVLQQGQLVLDTDSLLKTGVSSLLGLIPFCGSTLSTVAEKGIEIIQTHTLRENAAALMRIAYSEHELWDILKVVAKDIVQNRTKIEELESPKDDKQEKGIFKKLFSKISVIKEKVQGTIEGGEIYKTAYAQAAYEDVSHAIPEWIKYVKSTKKDSDQHTFFEKNSVITLLKSYIIGEESAQVVEFAQPLQQDTVTVVAQSSVFTFDIVGTQESLV